ncbi:MAG: RecJ, partial [uncultured Solirubrobacteraceae bacterium]
DRPRRAHLLALTGARGAAQRPQVPAGHPRAPGRRRHGLADGDAAPPRPPRQGRARLPAQRRVPAARRIRLDADRRPRHRAAGRPRRARARLPGLRQPRAQPGRRFRGERGADAQRRPSPRQHPLRHHRPRRGRGLLHRGDRLGPDDGPRSAAGRPDRRGAVRRPGDRHRALHVREHDRPLTRDGSGDHPRRHRRPRGLPAAVRGRAVRQAHAAGPGPGEPAPLRGRPSDALAAVAARLRGVRRAGVLRRGRRRPPARARGHRGGRPHPRARHRDVAGRPQGLAARHRRSRRRLADRPRDGRRRSPPGGGLRDAARAPRARRLPAARGSRPAL